MKPVILSSFAVVLVLFLTSTRAVDPISTIPMLDGYVEVPTGQAFADTQLTEVASFYIAQHEVTSGSPSG